MTFRIKPWHGIVVVVFLALVLVGIIIAALQGSAEAKAEGSELVAVAHATPTPEPTRGWWITVTQQWDGQATPAFTSTEGGSFGSQYVADVTISDGTEVNAGESFAKTWKVRNSGTCDWHAGFELVFVSGEQMDGPESVPLSSVPAGEEVDVSMDLVAPSEPGLHKGTWRIRPQGGAVFGTNLTVVIEVPSEGTAVPAMVLVGTPGPDATPAPATPAVQWR